MRAYVLVNTRPGKVGDIARQIAGIPGVSMANACWGMPDNMAGHPLESNFRLADETPGIV